MSDDRPRSRGRHQFGFNGPRRKAPSQDKDVSVDDILDSLSRRSQLSDRLDRVDMNPAEDELEQRFAPQGIQGLKEVDRHGSLGKYAFALLLLGGLVTVGLYGALKTINPSSILRVVQNPTFAAVFTDPVRLGLVVLFCAIPAFIVRRHRRVQNRLTYG